MGRNKQVVCGKCYRVMRCDNISRNKKMNDRNGEIRQKDESLYTSALLQVEHHN